MGKKAAYLARSVGACGADAMAGRGCKGAEANRFVGLGAGAVTGVGGVTAETGDLLIWFVVLPNQIGYSGFSRLFGSCPSSL